MTSGLFFAFVIVMAAIVSASLIVGSSSRRVGALRVIGLTMWLIYVGLVSFYGVVANTSLRPPGPVLIFAPVAAFILFLAIAPRLRWTMPLLKLPLRLLIATQLFRVVVELFLHQLWRDGLIPKMLTFAGANFDIYVGATAPLAAWLATRGEAGRRLAIAWNGLGLIALANVVLRAILTAPGPLNLLHAETPDRMIGLFPYTFLPGFLVPLAVALHILSLRRLLSRRAL